MTEDRTGRELTPRPDEQTSAVTPREADLPAQAPSADERFSAGRTAHTVGLTEERAAKIVKQSSNARMIAFLGALFLVLFIPIYWLYDIGMPVLGQQGRLAAEANEQQVTDISRGYALFLANCARCHGEQGQGLIGPALNDQGKLYNAVTAQGGAGTGHLNPDYLMSVLSEGGRFVCGNPNSVMPAWLDPKGPLNYRQVQQIIDWVTASSDIGFEYQPAVAEGAANASVPPPVTIHGWRDPSYTPPPGATPVPACWSGGTTTTTTAPSLAPIAAPGTTDNPRIIEVEGTNQIKWVDPATGTQISQLAIAPGETVEFKVDVNSDIAHNFHIGTAGQLSAASEQNDLPGLTTFANATQTFTYTFDSAATGLQFACTVPGHYQSMHVDLIPVGGGGSAASPAASGAAPGSAAPLSEPSAAPSAAPAASPAATPAS